MERNPSSSSRVADRKTIEKNRRIYMKDLCSKLHSLLPKDHSSREVKSQMDQLEEAANYIKKLEIKLEKMKEKKHTLMGSIDKGRLSSHESNEMIVKAAVNIDIHEATGASTCLEVNLICGLDMSPFLFNGILRMLHQQEHLDILNASFSVCNTTTAFHTIHSKVGGSGPRSESASLSERIKKFVDSAC